MLNYFWSKKSPAYGIPIAAAISIFFKITIIFTLLVAVPDKLSQVPQWPNPPGFFDAVIKAPIKEEIELRGLMFAACFFLVRAVWLYERMRFGYKFKPISIFDLPFSIKAAATVTQAVIFMYLHHHSYSFDHTWFMYVRYFFALSGGLIWGALDWRYKSILPGIFGHAVFNAF